MTSPPEPPPRADETYTIEDVYALGRELSNWGRWGPEDERGTLNHLGPNQRLAAATAMRSGRTFSLALPLKTGVGPQTGAMGRTNCLHVVTQTGDTTGPLDMGGDADFTDDMVVLSCQGSTQWDALSHIYYSGEMYNGVPATEVSAAGSGRNGIDQVHDGFVGRGVLLDLARHAGEACWDPLNPIRSEDLDACADAQGVTIEAGDIVIVRTGAMTAVDGDDWSGFESTCISGLHFTTVRWLAEHEVAAVAADNVMVEGLSPVAGVMSPLHMVAIRDMGLLLGELWFLEDLAADCANDGQYDFFLAAQALPIAGGCGSPVNPIAVK
ncbi:MAG: cyclase family protein [Microthrixaceae bacterium]